MTALTPGEYSGCRSPQPLASSSAQRLRQLEWERLIARTYHAEIPPRVEYQITELGRTLSPVFATLVRWSDVHLAAVEAARQDYDAAGRRRPV
jgi:DNA-binding HxlR family transcriptional regulator